MKNGYLVWMVLSLAMFGACKKDKACIPADPSTEDSQIIEFNIKNGLGTRKGGDGIYYNIVDPGSGISPSRTSQVVVTYSGRLMNNQLFDTTASAKTLKLPELIEGWQLSLPRLKKGGRIILIIPSVYAYGCNGNANLNVPANAVLAYDIRLIDVIP